MRNKNYRLVKQLHELQRKQDRGIKSVIWKLSEEQIAFFGKYYLIEAYSYSIKTKKFARIHETHSSLLKNIHYSNKKGKNTLIRRLSDEQKDLLSSKNVEYHPLEYRIILMNR